MASNRYCVDVAKRGTAGCKECKQKIEKGIVRIAKIIPNPFTDSGGDMKQWFHTKCIFTKLSRAKAATKKIESTDDLEGWDELDDEHKPEIENYIEEFSKLLPKTAQKRTPQKVKKKPEEEVEEVNLSAEEVDDSTPTKDDTLRQFRKIVAEVENVSEHNKKRDILANFFSKGSDGKEFKGNLYLWAKMLLPMVDKRVYNLQNRQLFKLFSNIFKCSAEDMATHFEESGEEAGDVAVTISVFFEESTSCPPTNKSTLYLQEVDKYLLRLSQVSREFDQTALLTEIAKKCTANDLKMFIRFIKHDLRMNAGPKPVLTAIHPTAYSAFQASRNLKEIINRALQEKSGKSSKNLTVQSSLMTPVLPMLAMACKSYEEVFKRCPRGFFVEIKYDGERVQLHKQGKDFSFFSRSLKPVMPHKVAHLKDYVPEAFPHGNNLMLDCEILLVDKDGKPLPFGTLGAHKKAEFKDASVCLFVFDCLQFNDENLMQKPLTSRRKILLDNMKPIKGHVQFSEMKEIEKMSELQATIRSVFKQGLEGVVVKAKDSVYEPGKRHWLKIKKDYLKEDQMIDTADLVVLGAFYGTGKFGGIKSTFLMGCLNNKTKNWCTVTKVHNGLDDEELDKLQKLSFVKNMKKISKDKTQVPSWLNVHDSLVPDFVVDEPKKSPVWEITGAEFTRTENHTANGISIRFPRVTKMRDDKTWKEATSLSELEDLFKKSKETSDIVGLGGINSVDESSNQSFKRSPEIKADESETPLKKKKTETSNMLSIKQGKRKANEISDSTSTKKKKEEKVKLKKSDKLPVKIKFPDVFTNVKLHVSPSLEKADLLRRYFIAYDGHLLESHEESEATHAIIHEQSKSKNIPKGVTRVPVDWLWDCIKLKKLIPPHLYKCKS